MRFKKLRKTSYKDSDFYYIMKKSCNEFKLEVEISADLKKGGCLSNASYIPIAKARGFATHWIKFFYLLFLYAFRSII